MSTEDKEIVKEEIIEEDKNEKNEVVVESNEENDDEERRKKNTLIIVIGIIIVSLIALVFLLVMGNKYGNNSNNKQKDEKVDSTKIDPEKDESLDLDDEEDNAQDYSSYGDKRDLDSTRVKLNDEKLTYELNSNLKIDFIGTFDGRVNEFDDNSDPIYRYKANVILNGTVVNSTFFDGSNIWSDNQLGAFRIYEFGNYYILESSNTGALLDGTYLLIMNKEGKILKTHSDIMFSYDKNTLDITITDHESLSGVDQGPSEIIKYNLNDLR